MKQRHFISHPFLRAALACSSLLAPVLAVAQDALRNTLQGEQWLAQRQRWLEQHPYNLRWGDWRVSAEATLNASFDSNVNLTDSDPEADVIFQPGARLFSVLPITERNALTFDLGLGYIAYLDHSEFNRLTVEPGSVLSLDAFLGNWRVNVHDRFSYLDDPLETGPVSGESRFGGLDNTAGLSIHRQLNELQLDAGYDFSLFRSSVERYDYLDRGTHAVFVRAAGKLAPELLAGLELSAGQVEYDQALLNNSRNASAGPYLDWRISAHLTWSLRGGYTYYTFDQSGLYLAPDDTGGFYLRTELNHQLNERLRQRASLVRSFEQGVNSELLDHWQVQHELDWRFIHRTPLRTVLFYEVGVESGGLMPDDYRRIGASVAGSRALGEQLSLHLEYAYTRKDSELAGRDYLDHRVTLGLLWRF